MKIPFPYGIAAEFVLFRAAAKFTLPHLLTCIIGALAGTLSFLGSMHEVGGVLAAISAVMACGVAGFGMFLLFQQVLPALRMLVKFGVVAIPNRRRMREKVRSYCGHRN